MNQAAIPRSRVSLADMARSTGTVLKAADSSFWNADARPTLTDISECLFFTPGDGRIWLNDQRMLLLHTSALGTLRRELIDSLGLDKARGLLTRMGYISGARDAQLVRERWPDAEPNAIFAAGTRLHALEGVVKVEPVHFEFDPDTGHYDGEFLWHHASEDDEHIEAYGLGSVPACWMQLGYAIGYVSTLLGQLVIFREVSCRSMGDAVCRVIGKTAPAWGDISEDVRYLNAQDFVDMRDVGVAPAASWPEDQPAEGAANAETGMVGASSAFNAACHLLQRVAPTEATVLFTGESGVGKERFANMLHRISRRADKPFVAVNCAAIPDTLVESELFGVERGAFTGATRSRAGRFERADGGTLFLDEIGTLSPVAQGKLLRALQQGEIERVGGERTLRVNVRVVAATNVDLRKAVAAGQFREDLFFRLNVFPIHLPPLRERRDDIPLLMNHFLGQYARRHGRRVGGFTLNAVRTLLSYSFPGNIRELQNLVERGVISAPDGAMVDLPHMFSSGEPMPQELLTIAMQGSRGMLSAAHAAGGAGGGEGLLELLQKRSGGGETVPLARLETELMEGALAKTKGNLSAAARLLGLTRPQLAYRLERAGIAVPKGKR